MFVDARTVPGNVLETEVCIIGAGAAGITLTHELKDSQFRVILLESGGLELDPETQSLYMGQTRGIPLTGFLTADGRSGKMKWCLFMNALVRLFS